MNRAKTILTHIYVWAFLISLYYTLAFLIHQKNLMVSDHIAKYLLAVSIFYINVLFLLPFFFNKKKYSLFILFEIMLAFFQYGLFYVTYLYILPAVTDYPKGVIINFRTAFPNSLWWYFTYSLYGFGFWYAKEAIKKQKLIMELQRQNFLNEFNALKLQINPHFLHNTLNTLFAQALPISDCLANNILKVSNLMRYSLQSLEGEDGKVLLKDEIHYLNDLIDIHQLRFDNKLQINVKRSGEITNQKIPALSLITAVENAFKYGDLKDPSQPLQISIEANADNIHFTCINKKKRKPLDASFGLGLNNLRKRLTYIFNDNYTLTTNDEGEIFHFELKIKYF